MKQLTGVMFGASSIFAPFFLGASVGAVTTGRVRSDSHGNVASAWLNPTAITTGVLFVSACAYVAAVYLVGDSRRRDESDMVAYFSRRAIVAGVVTGALAAVNMVLLHSNASYVFHRLVTVALPLVAVSVLGGLAALVLIVLQRPWPLRIASGTAVSGVIAAWGLAQYPWMLPTTLSARAASAPTAALQAELVVLVLAAVLVVPSFAYLYWLQQHGRLQVTESTQALRSAVAVEEQEAPGPASEDRRHRLLTTVLVGAAAIDSVRDARRKTLSRKRSQR